MATGSNGDDWFEYFSYPKKLTKEAQEMADEFEDEYINGCCSCHINPPCGYCTHPGNPNNLEADEDAWEPDNEARFK